MTDNTPRPSATAPSGANEAESDLDTAIEALRDHLIALKWHASQGSVNSVIANEIAIGAMKWLDALPCRATPAPSEGDAVLAARVSKAEFRPSAVPHPYFVEGRVYQIGYLTRDEITRIVAALRRPSYTQGAEAMREAGFLIWWTDQSDIERIEHLGLHGDLDHWPAYLTEQFESRNGRPGRGRLWVADEIEKDRPAPPEEAEFGEHNPVCRMASNCGGIVIRSRDYEIVATLPGFITTFACSLVRAVPLPDGEG